MASAPDGLAVDGEYGVPPQAERHDARSRARIAPDGGLTFFGSNAPEIAIRTLCRIGLEDVRTRATARPPAKMLEDAQAAIALGNEGSDGRGGVVPRKDPAHRREIASEAFEGVKDLARPAFAYVSPNQFEEAAARLKAARAANPRVHFFGAIPCPLDVGFVTARFYSGRASFPARYLSTWILRSLSL